MPSWAWGAPVVVLVALVPLITQDEVVLDVAIVTLVWAGVASAWNILAGQGGQLSFGHSAFFGTGAYTMGILYMSYGVSPWIGTAIGVAVSSGLAVIIGIPCFRLRGPYFALATMALAQAMYILCDYFYQLTGGSSGLALHIRFGTELMFWRESSNFVWLALAYAVLVSVVAIAIRHSRYGYFLAAIREDEEAAAVAGVNPLGTKMIALVTSAALTSIGGSILGRYFSVVDPDGFFGLVLSVQILAIAVIGGLGSLGGPVLGAAIVIPVTEYLRLASTSKNSAAVSLILYGVLFVLVIMFLPQGIFPAAVKTGRRLLGHTWG